MLNESSRERNKTMNDLQIFNHPEFGEVRWVDVEGKPGAVGVDVAKALGYAKPSQAVIDHCKGIRKLGIPSEGGIQETNIIPEGDIYRLIIKAADQSKNEDIKAKAEIFEKWIFDEVVPSIRRDGSYSKKPNLKKILELVKVKREFLILSGMPKHGAYSKALSSVEIETGVDLSEFKPAPQPNSYSSNLDIIMEALESVISNESNIYRHMGDESALIKEKVYSELDARGLARKKALAALVDAGILMRTSSSHYAKAVRLPGRRPIRAIVVKLGDI